MEPIIDPLLYERTDLRTALAAHQFGPVFDAVNAEAGLSYREIGRRTGTHESVIYEIRKGRTVENYNVLVRIAEGLAIPREALGLGFGTYADRVTVADSAERVDEAMRRRALLAAGATAVVGLPLLGEARQLPAPGEPMPSRIGMADVADVEYQTAQLRALARQRGGQASAVRAVADRAMQFSTAAGTDAVTARMGGALARLFTLAGWCCADSGHDEHVWYYLQRAIERASVAKDTYQLVTALRYSGALLRECGDSDNGLKLLQLGQLRLTSANSDDPRLPVLGAWLRGESALALATMGFRDQARTELAAAHDCDLPDSFERSGMDELTSRVHLDLGCLNVAEPFAASAVRICGAGERRNGVLARVTLATVHVQAGDPNGATLAKAAIEGVSELRSTRARERWLEPLADVLDTRPGSDARDVARMARQVATTRV
ncbi:MAG: helix-turn-helix domain-containing protein [Pseudonocardiaceae bacterium]